VVEVGIAAQRQQRCGADGDEGEGGQDQLGQENFACGGGGVSSSISAGP
jgi:hypothetical protein